MPFIKDNGQFRFTPEKCLTASQMKSYFSCLTRTRRKQVNDSQRLSNQSVTTMSDYQINSNDGDEEINAEISNEYDSQVAADKMADFQQLAKEILKK